VVTLAFAFLTPNSYRSTTRLMPPDNQSGSSMAAMANLASRVGGAELGFLAGDLLGSQSTGALFLGVLRSRSVQDKLVSQYDLQSVYGTRWLRMRVRQEDARKQLEFNTEASEDRKSGIITVSVIDQDPVRAAALAQGYVDDLNRLVAGLSTSAAGRERQFLEQRLVEVKKDLDDAARQLSEFSSKNSTLDPREQGKAMVDAAANLEGELIAAQAQLGGVQAIYTGNNIRVRSLQARIAELKKQLGTLSGAGTDSMSVTPDMPFPSMRQLPLLGATYADLYRRTKIQETVYQVLTQQYEMAKVQEAKEIPSVRVLDPADVPQKKWGPHRFLQALMGGMVGFLLGCVWMIGHGEWKKRTPEDPYREFFTEVGATLRGHRFWRGSEAGLRRVLQIHRDGCNGSNHNGSNPHA
jgi:capsule polysaccharide export protein KpsE/RkpR